MLEYRLGWPRYCNATRGNSRSGPEKRDKEACQDATGTYAARRRALGFKFAVSSVIR